MNTDLLESVIHIKPMREGTENAILWLETQLVESRPELEFQGFNNHVTLGKFPNRSN